MFLITLIALILLLIVIWLWQSNMRAKETAFAACKKLCKQHNCQLLDNTVALTKIQLKRGESGSMTLCRHYGFEYNFRDDTRRNGAITLLGYQVIHHQMISDHTLTETPVATNTMDETETFKAKILDFQKLKAKNDE